MAIITCFFLALIPSAVSISFNFTNISQNNSQDIILSGDAAYTGSDDGIQVTYRSINRSWDGLAGRATYIRPLHLWNNDSTDLASFSTTFTFFIKSYIENDNIYGNGLTFFIAQNNFVINAGGSLGLPFTYQTNTCLSPFVAVEFDTYGTDEWDPFLIGDHVGINVNSLQSVVSRLWSSDINNTGMEYTALIIYNSDSKILSVSYTNFVNNLIVWETGLNYTIDLRDVLPEWVIFGFSASTGDGYEMNNVRSWVFNSTELKGKENSHLAATQNIDPSSSVPPTKNVDQSGSVPPTKVGLLAGSLVFVFHYMAVL